MLISILLLGLLLMNSLGQDFLDKFNQHEYKIKDFRVELPVYNEDYFNYARVITFKYNRSTPAVNATFRFKISVEDKLKYLVQAYKFASNEYRLFPIHFLTTLKNVLKANVIGIQEMLKCGNINQLYFVKAVDYHLCNFVVDETKLPPLIPPGRYKVQLQVIHGNNFLSSIETYGEIYIPFKY